MPDKEKGDEMGKKNIITAVVAVLVIAGIATAVLWNRNHTSDQSQRAAGQNTTESTAGSRQENQKALIVYFSRVGNTDFDSDMDALTSASVQKENGELTGDTQILAEDLQEMTGGDLTEIIADEPYPQDYDETRERSHREKDENTLPGISTDIEDIESYDVIYLGYPVWSTTLPAPVKTFLSEHDFSGKTILPFCTHAGYGAGDTYDTIQDLSEGSTVEEGLAVEDSDLDQAQDLLEQWLNQES